MVWWPWYIAQRLRLTSCTLLCLLAGCSLLLKGERDPLHYYVFPRPPAADKVRSGSLAIEPVTAPLYLDATEMIRRSSDDALAYELISETERWALAPRELVSELVFAYFESRFQRVTRYPLVVDGAPTLHLRLLRFEQVRQEGRAQAVVEIEARLTNAKGQQRRLSSALRRKDLSAAAGSDGECQELASALHSLLLDVLAAIEVELAAA
jgi:ABC-type uncharacterized transport system auxiliary subunit